MISIALGMRTQGPPRGPSGLVVLLSTHSSGSLRASAASLGMHTHHSGKDGTSLDEPQPTGQCNISHPPAVGVLGCAGWGCPCRLLGPQDRPSIHRLPPCNSALSLTPLPLLHLSAPPPPCGHWATAPHVSSLPQQPLHSRGSAIRFLSCSRLLQGS